MDIFELTAKMNGIDDSKNLRSEGHGIWYSEDKSKYVYPNLVDYPQQWEWINEQPEECEYQGYFY